ncbi:MAG: MFS transporter [Rubrivivax sp.]|nr:MAG: MFS transporter [Rubrivivax sp.]
MAHRPIIWLAALWQLVFMVDFIAPLPLGPALSTELGFAAPQVAWLSVSYTLASLCSGLLAAPVVEKLGRRRTVLACLALFCAANLVTPWAQSLTELALCRAAAGLFGAPVVATLMALVIDGTPGQHRGKAISWVMSGASMAVIAGVPSALALANHWSWHAVFWVLGLVTLGLLAVIACLPPALMGHVSPSRADGPPAAIFPGLLKQRPVQQAFALQALSQFSTFLLIPVLATYLVSNRHVRTDDLPLLYSAGGLASLSCMHIAGRAADRWGHLGPLRMACVLLLASMATLAWPVALDNPIVTGLGFVTFMAANAAKNVALSSFTVGLAPTQHRAAFMNIQGSVQDLAILLAGLGPLCLLAQAPQAGQITGMPGLFGLAAVSLLILAFGVKAPRGHRLRSC